MNAGAYGHGMEGRSTAEDFRGKRRVEEEFRGNRADEDFREDFRGNRRSGEDFREEFRGNRRVEERKDDSRVHAVEDRMDHRGALRAEIPQAPRSSANDATGPAKGDVRSNVGAGVQGLQTNITSTATNTPREYPSTPVGHNRPDTNTHEYRTERPGQSSSPFLMNGLAYGPYQPGRPEGSYGGREDESSRGGESTENGRSQELEDANSAGGAMNSNDDANASALKRARLVWTPQLHKRFVEAVGHLGIKNAVPKTIMQLMNVEGLTRENVASHLQKYRLYLKRIQGLSNDGPSASDHLFASTPIPPGIMPPGIIPPGMSPHFKLGSGSQRDDGGDPFTTPIIPMPFQGLVRPGPFGAYDHMPYGSMAGGYMQQAAVPEHREVVPENDSRSQASHSRNNSHQNHQNQPSSSSQCVLPLFPTN